PIWRRPIVHHLGLGEGVRILGNPVGERFTRLFASARARLVRFSELKLYGPSDFGLRLPVTIGTGEQREELLLQLAQPDSVLWPLGTGDRRLDGREVHVEHGRVVALPTQRHPEQALGLEVASHRLDLVITPASRAEV